MTLSHSSPIIFDYVWRPLVFVPHDQVAFLVHPGTTMKATVLNSGWHWHWPWLTSIRCLTLNQIEFKFGSLTKSNIPFFDESIMAVSKDHHLFSTQGIISISVNPHAPTEVLARLNRHSTKRLLKPLIRQCIRQTLGQFDSSQISSHVIESTMLDLAQPLFNQQGLIIHQIKFTNLDIFQPLVIQKP